MSETKVETLVRPNGKPYRPRKGVEVVEYADHDECQAIAVLRTHDVQLAARVGADFIEEYELDAANAYTSWWRLIPWDTGSGYDRNWVEDSAGGTPCVVFPHEWSTPTPRPVAAEQTTPGTGGA